MSSCTIQHISVASEDASTRLDVFLSEKTGITRSQILKFVGEGRVLVNGKAGSANYKVKKDDDIVFSRPEEENAELVPEDIPVKILFRDEHLVVVNKPPGMVVYPAAGHSQGTLMNALLFHCVKLAGIGGPLRPGVAHRLDKDTSGVMVVALEDGAYYDLVEQFRGRNISRKYKALVFGEMKTDSGEISMSIGRSQANRQKMSTKSRRGKEAVTRWKVVRRFHGATLIEAKLGTGRTHQIRVHFAAIGHPVLGDITYGNKTAVEAHRKKITFPRQMLHAETLGFVHPATGERIEFSCPMPEDMMECIKRLEDAGRTETMSP